VRKALSGAHSGGRKFSDLGTSGEVVCMNSRISSIRLCEEDERILRWIRRFNERSEEVLEAKWRRSL
jgi:hypothetical protein